MRPARPLGVPAAFALAMVVTVLCLGGCSADPRDVDGSPKSSESSTADVLKGKASASSSPSASPPASPTPSTATPSAKSTPTRRAPTSSSQVGGSGGSTRAGGSGTTGGGSGGGSGTVPQNPNRGPNPPPAPPRPSPTPEWTSGAWQPGDPVEATAPVMTPGQGRPAEGTFRRRSKG